MHNYAQLSQYLLLPMAIGALLVLITALLKGDICPGQRGRLHQQLPIIAGLFFISAGALPAFLIPAGLLVYFSVQTQTGKTRHRGPLFLLYLCALSATLFWLAAIVSSKPPFIVGSLSVCVALLLFLGAVLAQLLLIRARSRLQAFHRLLPVTGIISLMMVVIAVLLQTYWAWSANSEWVVGVIVYAFPTLILAVVIWSWHLFCDGTVQLWQIALAGILALLGSYLLLPLF
ncbi:hypothetical protein [Vibrio rarus]|uniref:hypothetical protein n=1 Tax=Vibrio rarus TaxID=413403 RepID=UPI0021C4252D|nr:hypothetical protein [Vibrio rarus]